MATMPRPTSAVFVSKNSLEAERFHTTKNNSGLYTQFSATLWATDCTVEGGYLRGIAAGGNSLAHNVPEHDTLPPQLLLSQPSPVSTL